MSLSLMRRSILFLTLIVWTASLGFGQPGSAAGQPPAHATHRRLTSGQARRIVMLVARHDNIDLSDTHIELNSMDMGTDFVPGFSSFIVIRESLTPGPDETLRRYAVNRNTGDVWEMNLCTHYDFPELTRMQRSLAGRQPDQAPELAAQGRQLGCAQVKNAPTT